MINEYLHLYIGVNTNYGILTGVKESSCLITSKNGEITERQIPDDSIKPILRKINSLTSEQSAELNKKGFSIGRPFGYTFTPEAILYLLRMHVDLFNLIERGLATEIKENT